MLLPRRKLSAVTFLVGWMVLTFIYLVFTVDYVARKVQNNGCVNFGPKQTESTKTIFETQTKSTNTIFETQPESTKNILSTQTDSGTDIFQKSRQNGQQTIPKIIHQIWNDEILPEEFAENVRGLVRDNPAPEWKYYFWTKETGLNFIQQKYPYLYEKAKISDDLLRSDLLRYLVIYEYGGVYFDLDTVSVKPLRHFVDAQRCSFALEPAEHYFFYGNVDFMMVNGALFCVKKHPFYTHIVFYLTTQLKGCLYALPCTGPPALSQIYRHLNQTGMYAGEIPAVQRSEMFIDVYDISLQQERLVKHCFNNTNLLPFQKKICENWIARGMEKRNISAHALTYNTWFHVGSKTLTINKINHINNIVSQAMLYGKDFD